MIDRKDAAPAYRWDLTAIYKTEEDFIADCEATSRAIAEFPALREGITKNGEGLYRALEADTALMRALSKLYTYAMLASDLDKGDNAALARLARVEDIENAYRAAAYFLAPAIQAIDEDALAGYFQYSVSGNTLMVDEVEIKHEYQRTMLFFSLCVGYYVLSVIKCHHECKAADTLLPVEKDGAVHKVLFSWEGLGQCVE